jgi:Fur family transcriptional regulator, ferric uptake regulator
MSGLFEYIDNDNHSHLFETGIINRMDAHVHFRAFLVDKGIRKSLRRSQVLDVFAKCERHVTVNELVQLVHKKYPKIGIATVYRTLKLLCESGIARGIEFHNGTVRYEHDFGHEHHDHLVCLNCGAFVEISNSRIEEEQNRIAKEHGYALQKHKMILYGVCPKCSRRK